VPRQRLAVADVETTSRHLFEGCEFVGEPLDLRAQARDLASVDELAVEFDGDEEEQVQDADDGQHHQKSMRRPAFENMGDGSDRVGVALAPHRATSCSARASRRNLTASSGGVGLTKKPAPQ